jgi:hypothetical protein
MAFHDLTTRLKPPRNLLSLLGLNLKFIPNPQRNVPWAKFDEEILPRSDRGLSIKLFMAGQGSDDTYNAKMYVRSEWTPRNWQIPQELITRLSNFKQALKDTVKPRRCARNLLPHQLRALKHLRNQSDFIVAQCDKKLGHSVIEKDEYI